MDQVVTLWIFYLRGFRTFDVSHALVSLMFIRYIYLQEGIHIAQRKVILSLQHRHTLAGVCDRHVGAAGQEDEVMMK